VIGDTDDPNLHTVLNEDGFMLVVQWPKHTSSIQDPERLLWQERVIAIAAIMVARYAIDRTRVARMVFRRAADQLM
jgi:hypothetical protein